jgi:predicted dehydrogenase
MINAAVYGLGRWGRVLVDSVQGKSDKIKFTSAISRSPQDHQAYAAEKGLTVTNSLSGVLSDDAVDAIVLASPPWLHAEQAIAAAQAGKPVYVEKPFTLSHEEAKRAAAAADKAGIVMAVGFNRRYLNAMQELKSHIAAGTIGELLHIEGQFSGPTLLRTPAESWRATRDNNPAGGMVARGIHLLDNMIDICGSVDTVFADSSRRIAAGDIDDATSVLMNFKNGITGYLSTIMVTGEYFRIQVLGSGGWIELLGYDRLNIADLDGVQKTETFEPMDLERATLEAFADAIGGSTPFSVTPAQAVHGIAVLEAIDRSAKDKTQVKVAP